MEKLKVHKNEPTFFELIQRYFPEPYKTIYSDPFAICKALQGACNLSIKESCLNANPDGSISYWDRCAVHQMVSELQKQHPEWRNEDYVKYLETVKVRGGGLMYGYRTLKRWVSEIVPSKRGRPRGRTNTIKR